MSIDWEKIESAISLCVDLLKDRLFLTSGKAISSYNSLIPIIYWVFKRDIKGLGAEKSCLNDSDVNKIRTWLIKALLNGIFGGQSDAILYKCKEAIDASDGSSFPAETIENKINSETRRTMKIDSEKLNEVLYNSTDSHLVLSVCYKGSINFYPKMKGNLPEQDHIFSQDELKKAGIEETKINCIYNIRYIGSSENKTKSKTPFADWMESIGKNKDELKKHLIPDGNWDLSKFDEFFKERKKLIEENFKY